MEFGKVITRRLHVTKPFESIVKTILERKLRYSITSRFRSDVNLTECEMHSKVVQVATAAETN